MRNTMNEQYKRELMELAKLYEPQLVPTLEIVFEAGGVVRRRKTGQNQGALYISLSKSIGADYSKWQLLNCGDNLRAYQRLQELSRRQYYRKANQRIG